MSTRCQIQFIYNNKEKVLTYRHSDGYLNGVVPDLVEFLKWHAPRNDQFDYLVPNYFYWNKRWSEKHYDTYYKQGSYESIPHDKPPIERVMGGNEHVLLGYGLDADNLLHGDIEYFYKVYITNKNKSNNLFDKSNLQYKIKAYTIADSDSVHKPKDIPETWLVFKTEFDSKQLENLNHEEFMELDSQGMEFTKKKNGDTIELYASVWPNGRIEYRVYKKDDYHKLDANVVLAPEFTEKIELEKWKKVEDKQ